MNFKPSPSACTHLHRGPGFFLAMKNPKATNINKKLPLIIFASLLFLSGCDKNQLAPLDSKNSTPFVSQLRFNPDSIYIDNLAPVNSQYTITTTVDVVATDNDGSSDLMAVTVDIQRSSGALAASGIPLHDDGALPDSVRADGIFSGFVHFSLTRAQAGRYQVQASAIDRQGSRSNSLAKQLQLTRRNSVPSLFDLVVVPETLTIAPLDSALLRMSIAASDSDGLADIAEVYWKSPDGQNPDFKFPMKDDGGLSIGQPSGDPVAGDGIFSFRQWIKDSPTIRGTYRLLFKAADSMGDTSSTILYSLVIR
jgi:hypothetical protein